MALVVILGTLMASGAHAGTDVPPQRKRALLAWLKAGTYSERVHPRARATHLHERARSLRPHLVQPHADRRSPRRAEHVPQGRGDGEGVVSRGAECAARRILRHAQAAVAQWADGRWVAFLRDLRWDE